MSDGDNYKPYSWPPPWQAVKIIPELPTFVREESRSEKRKRTKYRPKLSRTVRPCQVCGVLFISGDPDFIRICLFCKEKRNDDMRPNTHAYKVYL